MRPGIVGGERVVDVSEGLELREKITRRPFEILRDVPAVDAERPGGFRHELAETKCAFGAHGGGAVGAFRLDQGAEKGMPVLGIDPHPQKRTVPCVPRRGHPDGIEDVGASGITRCGWMSRGIWARAARAGSSRQLFLRFRPGETPSPPPGVSKAMV